MLTDQELLKKQAAELARNGRPEACEMEPTGAQCSAHECLFSDDVEEFWACWYPQMGGYVGKCVVVVYKAEHNNTCFDALVWHDGEFPFGGRSPRHIHHCCPKQFERFGQFVQSKQPKED